MNENTHERAQQLLAQSLVEGLLTGQDRAWLDAHLRECPGCGQQAATLQELLGALRRVPVAVPSDLAARTQMRLRLRAQQSAESSGSKTLLWMITATSWVLGVLSAPLVWRAFSWVGERLNVPKPVLELGFVLWWAVPALIALGVVLHQRGSHGIRSTRGTHV